MKSFRKKVEENGKIRIKSGRGRDIIRMFFKNKPAAVSLFVFTAMMLFVLLGPLFVDESLCYEVTGKPLEGFSAEHLLGTDHIGRDYLARILYGGRVSILTGLAATALSMVLGALVGCACGYFGGWFDNVCMRFFDILMVLPGMLLTMILVAVLGRKPENIVYALTISFFPAIARSIRAMVLNLTDMEYIRCAKTYGTKSPTIIVRHVMPNAMGVLILDAASGISSCILAASGFSYLGFGVQAPAPEWGALIAASKSYMRTAPLLTLVPGIAILITAVTINLIGDGLRDALDPMLRD